jgi:hypothetical protein
MEAKQTPLIELLEQVPHDARVVVEHDQFSSSSHPVGRLCHEAAAALRARLAQPEMKPCAGRNCGSTNPNLHSAECFEDYEKSTGMNQWQGLTDQEINSVCYRRDWTAPWTNTSFARAIEAKLKDKNT